MNTITNDNDIFGPQESRIAKGVAIILMLIHHLFTFPDRLQGVEFKTLFSFVNAEYWIGDFGKICVASFLFLSGYGLYKGYKKPVSTYYVKRLWTFYKLYWSCFLVFVPIGFIFFRHLDAFQWDIKVFLLSVTGLNATYNAEWWFVKLYILLVILFPLLYAAVSRFGIHAFLLSCFVFLFPRKFIPYDPVFELYILCYWQFPFIIGMLFAKHNLFNLLHNGLEKYHFNKWYHYIGVLFIIFLFRERSRYLLLTAPDILFPRTYYDPFIVPVFVYFATMTLKSIRLHKVFEFFGHHTLYIWLTHTFFCYYFWPELTYYPKLSILIFRLLVLSVGTSFLLNQVNSGMNFITKKAQVLLNTLIPDSNK